MCGHHIAVYYRSNYVACTVILLLFSRQTIREHEGIFYA